MGTFMGFAIGFFIGLFLGSMGMYLLIKQTAADRAIEAAELTKIIERQAEDKSIDLDDPWDTEELPEPKEEIKYGEF